MSTEKISAAWWRGKKQIGSCNWGWHETHEAQDPCPPRQLWHIAMHFARSSGRRFVG